MSETCSINTNTVLICKQYVQMGEMFLCQSIVLSDNAESESDALALKHTVGTG
jgi:hypothetical protein